MKASHVRLHFSVMPLMQMEGLNPRNHVKLCKSHPEFEWMLAGDENPRLNLDIKTPHCLSRAPTEDIKLLCPFWKKK